MAQYKIPEYDMKHKTQTSAQFEESLIFVVVELVIITLAWDINNDGTSDNKQEVARKQTLMVSTAKQNAGSSISFSFTIGP